LLLLTARLVLFAVGGGVNNVFHPLPHPSCGSAAFEPPESHEGLCTVYERSTGIVVRNIVDRDRILHMPEYDARVITWTMAPTHVSNWREEPPGLYPQGRGLLVSVEVEISNPADHALQFGPLIARSSTPSYSPNPPAELTLPIFTGPDTDTGIAALLNPRGAPEPSLFGQPPIEPRASITGWLSFVVRLGAGSLVGTLRSGLTLYPIDGNPNYQGIVRLWKSAGPPSPSQTLLPSQA
jgi:hypothetical protein